MGNMMSENTAAHESAQPHRPTVMALRLVTRSAAGAGAGTGDTAARHSTTAARDLVRSAFAASDLDHYVLDQRRAVGLSACSDRPLAVSGTPNHNTAAHSQLIMIVLQQGGLFDCI